MHIGLMTAWAISKEAMVFKDSTVPRSFVPLTPIGKLALKVGLHRGWREAVPEQIGKPLKKLRKHWYHLRWRLANECP